MQKHKIPKSRCEKTLVKLASGDDAQVVVKEFGKSKVYYISQEGLPALSEEEIREKNACIEESRRAIEEKGAVVAGLKAELQQLTSRKTLEELEAAISAAEKEAEALEKKLEGYTEGNVVAIKKEDVDKVEGEVRKNVGLWRKRKRSLYDIWGAMTENADGNVDKMWSKIGVEEDVRTDDIGLVEDAEKLLGGHKKRMV
jgi:hypothetical protein